MRSLSGLVLISALALTACSSKPSNAPAPAAPDVAKGSAAPVAPDVAKGSAAPVAPDVAKGSAAPVAPDVAKGSAAPVAPDVTDEPNIPGGGCAYTEFAGTCELTELGDLSRMTFSGTIDGAAVRLAGNAIRHPEWYFKPPAIGTTIACSIKFATKGGCTPCVFSIDGECGEAAWDALRVHNK